MNSDPRVLAYMAGFVDGEGHLSLHEQRSGAQRTRRLVPFVAISQKDPVCLQWVAEKFGGSLKFNARGYWHWTLRNQAALDLLEALLPYLILKRPQAELLLTVRLRRYHKVPSTHEERQAVKRDLQELRR